MSKKKVTNISKLLKKHRTRRKPKHKAKIKMPRLLKLTQLKKKIKEEQDLRNHLSQVIQLEDDEELLLATKKFTGATRDSYHRRSRKSFFFGPVGVMTILPPSEYREFIINYLNQPTERTVSHKSKGKIIETRYNLVPKGLNDFWDLYVAQPRVQQIIESRAKEIEEDEEEQRRLRKALDELQSDEEVVEDVLRGPPSQPPLVRKRAKPRTTIMVEPVKGKDGKVVLDVDGKPLLRTVIPNPSKLKIRKTTLGYNDKCVRDQRSAPWIQGIVRGCYILPVVKENLDKYANTKYDKIGGAVEEVTFTTGPYAHQTKKVYRANLSFYKLLCGRQSGMNEQEGEVLHARTSAGKTISFYVAYKIMKQGGKSSRMVIQNEELAMKKAKWYTRARDGRVEKMERLLEGPVTPILVDTCVDSLSASLSQIGGVLGNQEGFARSACEAIDSKSDDASMYIFRVANILAYLRDPGSIVFRQRVKEGWYSPRTFVSLTPQQMFPHSTIDGGSQIARSNAMAIVARQKRIVALISKLYYQINYPSERIPTRPTILAHNRIVKINEWRENCENKESIRDVPDYRLVTYDEGGKIYCLDMNELKLQIRSKYRSENDLDKIINPTTKIPLRGEFIRVLMENFDNINWKDEDDEDEDDEDDEDEDDDDDDDDEEDDEKQPTEKMLAPGLIDLLLANISSCKDELARGHLDEDNKCSGKDGGATMDRTKIEEEDTDSSDTDSSDTDSSDSDTDSDTVPPPPPAPTPPPPAPTPPPTPSELSPHEATKCETCGNKLDPELAYKTKRENIDGTYTTERFCTGEKCMGKATFKRGGRKKGGRKGAKDRKK